MLQWLPIYRRGNWGTACQPSFHLVPSLYEEPHATQYSLRTPEFMRSACQLLGGLWRGWKLLLDLDFGRGFLTPLLTTFIWVIAILLLCCSTGIAISYPSVFLDLPVTGESCQLLSLWTVWKLEKARKHPSVLLSVWKDGILEIDSMRQEVIVLIHPNGKKRRQEL